MLVHSRLDWANLRLCWTECTTKDCDLSWEDLGPSPVQSQYVLHGVTDAFKLALRYANDF